METMLSIIIPVYNEWQSLKELHDEIEAVIKRNHYTAEIIFVDDGSTDQSWQIIKSLVAHNRRLRALRLRCNLGKATALNAGIKTAQGEIIITLDADLQHNPQDIPALLRKLQEGYDVVSGWQKMRNDKQHRITFSRAFNWLARKVTGIKIHDINCGMKCYRRDVFHNIHLYGELHRFIPFLAAANGWKIGEAIISNRPRKFGHSKYAALHKQRGLKGIVDLITVKFTAAYHDRPQHIFGSYGLVLLAVSIVTLLVLLIWGIISHLDTNPNNDLLVYQQILFYVALAVFVLGAQLFSLGLLAGLMTTYYKGSDNQSQVAEQIDNVTPSTKNSADSH